MHRSKVFALIGLAPAVASLLVSAAAPRASAAPVIRLDSTARFDFGVPIGGTATSFGFETVPVATIGTLGTDLASQMLHISSFLRAGEITGGASGRWTTSVPEGTTGRGAAEFVLDVLTERPGGGASDRANVLRATETGGYECEAPEGCPEGEPDVGFQGLDFSENLAPGSILGGTVSSPGREVSALAASITVTLSDPQHGRGRLDVAGSAELRQSYEVRYDKLFAGFLADTASEFDTAITVIDVGLSPFGGASDAEIAGNLLVQAGNRLLASDDCAANAISTVAKDRILNRLDRLTDAETSPASRYTAPAGLAADVVSVVAGCLAADPPDLEVNRIVDPDDLLAGVEVPDITPTAAGAALAEALERDLEIGLLLAGALDAFERYQGALILGDDEAAVAQLESYFALMERVRLLALESAAFHERDLAGLLEEAGVLLDVDPEALTRVLALIEAEGLAALVGTDDPEVLAFYRDYLDGLRAASPVDPLAGLSGPSRLYGLVGDYAATDAPAIAGERIGGRFWLDIPAPIPAPASLPALAGALWLLARLSRRRG